MIFSFGKGRKLSDLTKLAEFLEKEGIEYQMTTDIQLNVGPVATEAPSAVPSTDDGLVHVSQEEAKKRRDAMGIQPVTAINNDPAWVPAHHDNIPCHDKACKVVQHYGGQPL